MRTVELTDQVLCLYDGGVLCFTENVGYFSGGDFPTAGSQVSTLGLGSRSPCHWFTASPSPAR